MRKKIAIQIFTFILLPVFLFGQYFEPVWTSPYNPMTVYAVGATLNGTNLQAGDEIGVFDIDPNTSQEICVGAGILTQPLTGGAYIEIIASMNDGSIPGQANGFTPGHAMLFKYFSQESGLVEDVTATFPYPGYDEVFTSQGNAFVSLSGTIQGLLVVSTSSNPPQAGTTSGGGSYSAGSQVTVEAFASDCWNFESWTENETVVCIISVYTFIIEESRNLVANFEQVQYQVITQTNPAAGGTASGGGTYNCGDEVTVVATANNGYTFVNWTENGTEVSNMASYTFVLENDRNLAANFQVEINWFEPVWTSPYNPMTIYVLGALLDMADLQPGSQIGIFDIDPNTGDEICVGAKMLTNIINPTNYLEIITSMNDGSVAGHANGFTPGHPFIFKYMTTTGQLVEQVSFTFPYPGYHEVFTSQGSAIVELSGTGTQPEEQNISLSPGWNAVSSYLIPQNTNIQNVLSGIETQLLMIKNLDKYYQPGNLASTLQNWNYLSGYFIKVTDETTLTISGINPSDKSLNLTIGWNLIPVISSCETGIATLFAGNLDKVEFIKDGTGTAVYWPFYSINSLNTLMPGRSYLIKVTQNIQVTFPECD